MQNAYEISWSVDNPNSGNYYGQQESRSPQETTGKYFVLLPDGRIQTVIYRVDPFSGFVAQVFYEEAGLPVQTTPAPFPSTTVQNTFGGVSSTQSNPASSPSDSGFGFDYPTVPPPANDFPPPDYPIFSDDIPFDFSPDYPTIEEPSFAPDYPQPSGGLFPGEEEVKLVPDPPISSFFPGTADRNGVGIRFPGESSNPSPSDVFSAGNGPAIPSTSFGSPNANDLETLINLFKNVSPDSNSFGPSLGSEANSLGFDENFPAPPVFIPDDGNAIDPFGQPESFREITFPGKK